jgi:NADH:ubiquinone oxidoreductase subunit 6 (subunit J)
MSQPLLFLLPVVLGFLAVYALLPRVRSYPAFWGASAAGLALLLAGWLLVRLQALTPEVFLFYIFSALSLLSGGLLVTQRNPARAALSFALVVLSTCGLFLLLAGPFLMAATTIIYAGAIVVTFLFVIMLAQQHGRSDADQRSREPLLSCVAGFVLLGALLYLLQASYASTAELDRLQALVRRSGEVERRVYDLMDKQRRHEALSREEVQGVADQSEAVFNDYDQWARDLLEDRAGVKSRTHHTAEEVALLDDVAVNARPVVAVLKSQLRETTDVDLDPLQERLNTVRGAGQRFQQTLSFLQPREQDALSEFSGPSANRWGPSLTRDGAGVPHLPAENVAYLGRSLFSDYLIAVELAGTLLLAATIGAIAIASRRAEEYTQ